MNIDHTILTVITFVPLAGAVLLAFLPDKGKLMQWGALAVTLITFVLTLHLPFRYDYSAASDNDGNRNADSAYEDGHRNCDRYRSCDRYRDCSA